MTLWFNTMLSGPVNRQRCFTLLHRSPEPQEEALANAEQGKNRFFRLTTTRHWRPIDQAGQETAGHDAPYSPRRISPIWSFSATIARLGQRLPTKLESPLGVGAPWHRSQSEPTSWHDSPCSGRRATMLTLSSDLLRTCAVAQVATRPEAWRVLGRRWKTAKFIQAHNELATRRGAHLATIHPPPRTQSSTCALQEYFRTLPASPMPRACCNAPPRDDHGRVDVRSGSSHFPRRGAASKLLPFPSAKNAQGPYPLLLAKQRKERESMLAELRAVGMSTGG
jgi:hypothetical protein